MVLFFYFLEGLYLIENFQDDDKFTLICFHITDLLKKGLSVMLNRMFIFHTCPTNLNNKNTLPPFEVIELISFLISWNVIKLIFMMSDYSFRVSGSNGSSMHVIHLLIYLSRSWSVAYFPRRMSGRNYRICHYCRAKGHSFVECPQNADARYVSMDSRSISCWRKKRSTKGNYFFAAVIIVDFETEFETIIKRSIF